MAIGVKNLDMKYIYQPDSKDRQSGRKGAQATAYCTVYLVAFDAAAKEVASPRKLLVHLDKSRHNYFSALWLPEQGTAPQRRYAAIVADRECILPYHHFTLPTRHDNPHTIAIDQLVNAINTKFATNRISRHVVLLPADQIQDVATAFLGHRPVTLNAPLAHGDIAMVSRRSGGHVRHREEIIVHHTLSP